MTKLLRATTGPYTRAMRLSEGRFGLGSVPERLAPDGIARTICGYCSTGCSLTVHLKGDEVVNLTPSAEYPVNLGHACPKGWHSLEPLGSPGRGTAPLVRDSRGRQVAIDWPAALELMCSRFKEIQAEHGPASVAFLGTGQCTSEELALLGALTKHGMGMVHGDGNTRQCMATAVTAYKRAFGFDAPPYSYRDFEESDVIVLVGSNLCIAHPIMWERVCRNPHDPTVVVIDPRKTETAMAADQHYAVRPKADLALMYGVANRLIAAGAIDRGFIEAHTSGFSEFARFVAGYTPARVCRETGLSAEQLDTLATTIAGGKRVSFWWTMGVNQSHEGVAVAESIINLALITGNIGRPGTGANSVTGQCNAMGSRLFSNTSSLFCGRDFTRDDDRAEVADILGHPAEAIPSEPSYAYDQIMEAVLAGEIRGLWIIATNTAHSWINQNDARDVLDRLDYLVVQDIYPDTDTAQRADLFLPAAGWGEKEGTFINSERRIGRVKRVRRPPGQAMTDFDIFRAVAEFWGCGEMFRGWDSPEAVFRILQRLSEGRPCDITGIESYDQLEAVGGVQWPCPEPAAEVAPERRLFEDGGFFHDDGRARIQFADPRDVAESAGGGYPLTLLTGRGSSSQWHTQTRTSRSSVLRELAPARAYVELSPVDARTMGVRPNDWVVVESRRGKARVRAFVTHTVPPGSVFMAMHYAETNRLTFPSFDPLSRQPSYKACAVRVTRAEHWREPG